MGLKLNTASSGSVTLEPANTASNYTLTVPAQTGTVVATDSSGNVGIGTSSPNAKLTSTATNGNTAISIIDTTNTTLGTETNYLSFYGTTAGGSLITTPLTQIGAISENGTYQQGSLVFKTTPYNSSSTERMRIDSSGKLLVGRTSAMGNEVASFDGSATGIAVTNDDLNHYTVYLKSKSSSSSTHYAIGFINSAGTAVGNITHNSSNTSYNTSSDYRLKENIEPMTGALAKVQLLKPCTYTWKETGRSSEGFIAHELQEVVPECVTGEKDAVNEDGSIKPQGIDTSFLVATLTAAIQELKDIVDAQALKIQALENK